MTPKEKAKELIDKMKLRFNIIDELNYDAKNEYGAKQCALICVDEILTSNEYLFGQMDNDDSYYDGSYWQEVKEEIGNL